MHESKDHETSKSGVADCDVAAAAWRLKLYYLQSLASVCRLARADNHSIKLRAQIACRKPFR